MSNIYKSLLNVKSFERNTKQNNLGFKINSLKDCYKIFIPHLPVVGFLTHFFQGSDFTDSYGMNWASKFLWWQLFTQWQHATVCCSLQLFFFLSKIACAFLLKNCWKTLKRNYLNKRRLIYSKFIISLYFCSQRHYLQNWRVLFLNANLQGWLWDVSAACINIFYMLCHVTA